MKYSLRSVMRWGLLYVAGTLALGTPAFLAVVLSVAFVLESLGYESATYDQSFRGHPFKAVASSLMVLGIGAVCILVLRYFMRVMWHDGWKAIVDCPPSWGEPPSLPSSSAHAPNSSKP
jgi:hypothetical protein